MKTGLKRSKQRDAILDYLKSTKEHPTADMVYLNVREVFPNISLGTVYRNLNLLAECGDIIKLSCDGKSERFDGNIEPHYHIMCTECGNVMDLDMEPLNHINILAESAFEGTVQDHVIYFKGICKKCLKGIDTVDK
ncbi:MAG: transcriptional repressor [Lachnospiraceae bacterium]|nr:transcriptional repressor [Lachnospiraceae bacterium]